MKERPILFSGAMVRALLDGSKTQTRRIVKLPHNNRLGQWEPTVIGGENGGRTAQGETIPLQGGIWHTRTGDSLMCPHGSPGDRLYVRETCLGWWMKDPLDEAAPRVFSHVAAFAADGYELEPGERWIPSIHMPRIASRITLEITGVRVERLQAMEGQTAFESEALKEGIKRIHHGDGEYSYHVSRTEPHPNNWTDPCDAFRDLWDSLNAARGHGWVTNPWVWVIEFKRIDA